jgi:hypothetical protein
MARAGGGARFGGMTLQTTLTAHDRLAPATAPGEVSLIRLYVLRATYLFMVAGLGVYEMPDVLSHSIAWGKAHGAVGCLLAGVWAMAVIGLRYPLKMLPLLLFELFWKSLWLIVVAWPTWAAHQMDEATSQTVFACGMGVVIFPLAIPWGYVWKHYVTAAGDRWR